MKHLTGGAYRGGVGGQKGEDQKKKQILTDKEECRVEYLEREIQIRDSKKKKKKKWGVCFGLLCLHYQLSSLRHIEGSSVSDSGEDKRWQRERQTQNLSQIELTERNVFSK